MNFLELWFNKDESKILNLFRDELKSNPEFVVRCHFNSDLLILSNVPNNLNPYVICKILNIHYNVDYGANTFMSEDIIVNVAKIKMDKDLILGEL